jgi:hypothetical protein
MTFLIYINLACVVVSTYFAATAEDRFGIMINTVAVVVNVLIVALHLAR